MKLKEILQSNLQEIYFNEGFKGILLTNIQDFFKEPKEKYTIFYCEDNGQITAKIKRYNQKTGREMPYSTILKLMPENLL